MGTTNHWIPGNLAAGLIREAYSRAEGPTEDKFDLIVERAAVEPSANYAMWRFYIVQKNSNKDAAFAFGMKAVEIVAGKVLGAVGPGGDLGDAAGAISSVVDSSAAMRGQSLDFDKIRSDARLLGGHLQLAAAKKMGGHAYNECRKFGAIARMYHCGGVKVQILKSGVMQGIEMHMRGWRKEEGFPKMREWLGVKAGGSGNHPVNGSQCDRWKHTPAQIRGDFVYDAAARQLI